jgi:hypothetical protein
MIKIWHDRPQCFLAADFKASRMKNDRGQGSHEKAGEDMIISQSKGPRRAYT